MTAPTVSRRSFLQTGAAALTLATAASAAAGPQRATSCIFALLTGGPSHLDTFDPKPDAPAEVRGPFTSIATSVPGMRIGEHLPRLAERAHRWALVRSIHHAASAVHETGNVNTLVIENRCPDRELFVQSGDMIKGGRQDRMIATDMLLPPGSGQVPFPAHCVEQGRWTGRQGENAHHFYKCDSYAAGKDLKLANASRDQSAVWAEVRGNQEKLSQSVGSRVNDNTSPTSFQLTLENPVVQAKMADFEKALRAAGEARPNVVGVVIVVNGKVTGAEVYGSNGLFRKAWPKLLKSASVEALAERKDRPSAPPSAREVEAFLVAAAKAEPPAAGPDAQVVDAEEVGGLRGRSGATGNRAVQAAGGRAGQQAVEVVNEVYQTEGRAVSQTESSPAVQVHLPRPATRAALNPSAGQQARQRGSINAFALDPVADNVGRSGSGRGVADPAPQQPGNRLNVNRVDNRAAVVIEARDAAKPSAVIHRSYITK